MDPVTQVSTKGQVVIPSHLRRAKKWPAGTRLAVVDRPDGLLLRPLADAASPEAIHRAIVELQASVGYTGPRIPDSEWEPAIDALFRQSRKPM